MKQNLDYIKTFLNLFNLSFGKISYNNIIKKLENKSYVKIYDKEKLIVGKLFIKDDILVTDINLNNKHIISELIINKNESIVKYEVKEKDKCLNGNITFSKNMRVHKNKVKTVYRLYKNDMLTNIGKFGSYCNTFFLRNYSENKRLEKFKHDIKFINGKIKSEVTYKDNFIFYSKNHKNKDRFTFGGVKINKKTSKEIDNQIGNIIYDFNSEYFDFIKSESNIINEFSDNLFDNIVNETFIYADSKQRDFIIGNKKIKTP